MFDTILFIFNCSGKIEPFTSAVCDSSSQYIYILYKFLFFLFSFLFVFEVQQETKYPNKSDQRKHKRPSSFQMAFYQILFKHLIPFSFFLFLNPHFCNPKYYLKFLFLFFNSLAQFLVGVRAATVQVRRDLSLCVLTANFRSTSPAWGLWLV